MSRKVGIHLFSAAFVMGWLFFPGITALSNLNPNLASGSGAILAGPVLTIPSLIPANVNSQVVIPVQFTSNGNSIASIGFSIDYDQTWLHYNPALPNSFTLNLPSGFTGDCQYNLADTDGEIDCFVVDPIVPIGILPDGVIALILLETLNAPNGTIAPVNFSANPIVTFGDPNGQYVSGSGVGGSVSFGQAPPGSFFAFLPYISNSISLGGYSISGEVTDPYNYAIQDALVCAGSSCTNSEVFGDYVLSGLNPSPYNVTATKPGLTCVPVFTNPVVVPPSATNMNFICTPSTPGFFISGIIKDHLGNPMNGVLVADPGIAISTLSDPRGVYYLTNLATGYYNLTAQKTGYACPAIFYNPVGVPPSRNHMDFICTSNIY